jgi:hypothetical protein
MSRNRCQYTRPLQNPYEIWQHYIDGGNVEIRVLKKDDDGRCFVAMKGDKEYDHWQHRYIDKSELRGWRMSRPRMKRHLKEEQIGV